MIVGTSGQSDPAGSGPNVLGLWTVWTDCGLDVTSALDAPPRLLRTVCLHVQRPQ